MWVTYNHEFAIGSCQILLHFYWVTEILGRPREVLFGIGVINIQPDCINLEVVVVEVCYNVFDFFLGVVAVAALVVP